jgi:hypothetical protein
MEWLANVVAIAIILFFIYLVFFAKESEGSMRCNGRFIEKGDDIEYVLEECGDPNEHVESKGRRISDRQRRLKRLNKWESKGGRMHYQREGQFERVIEYSNDKVVDIHVR